MAWNRNFAMCKFQQISDVSLNYNCSGKILFEKKFITNHFIVSKNLGFDTPREAKTKFEISGFCAINAQMGVVKAPLEFNLFYFTSIMF